MSDGHDFGVNLRKGGFSNRIYRRKPVSNWQKAACREARTEDLRQEAEVLLRSKTREQTDVAANISPMLGPKHRFNVHFGTFRDLTVANWANSHSGQIMARSGTVVDVRFVGMDWSWVGRGDPGGSGLELKTGLWLCEEKFNASVTGLTQEKLNRRKLSGQVHRTPNCNGSFELDKLPKQNGSNGPGPDDDGDGVDDEVMAWKLNSRFPLHPDSPCVPNCIDHMPEGLHGLGLLEAASPKKVRFEVGVILEATRTALHLEILRLGVTLLMSRSGSEKIPAQRSRDVLEWGPQTRRFRTSYIQFSNARTKKAVSYEKSSLDVKKPVAGCRETSFNHQDTSAEADAGIEALLIQLRLAPLWRSEVWHFLSNCNRDQEYGDMAIDNPNSIPRVGVVEFNPKHGQWPPQETFSGVQTQPVSTSPTVPSSPAPHARRRTFKLGTSGHTGDPQGPKRNHTSQIGVPLGKLGVSGSPDHGHIIWVSMLWDYYLNNSATDTLVLKKFAFLPERLDAIVSDSDIAHYHRFINVFIHWQKCVGTRAYMGVPRASRGQRRRPKANMKQRPWRRGSDEIARPLGTAEAVIPKPAQPRAVGKRPPIFESDCKVPGMLLAGACGSREV
ncbi:hypothetical protein C8R47DRAFT_1083311 [Mycena vitilis]|nr:hypothetical protein C8R47DRAFT_1083311 [Mycena vitilis]